MTTIYSSIFKFTIRFSLNKTFVKSSYGSDFINYEEYLINLIEKDLNDEGIEFSKVNNVLDKFGNPISVLNIKTSNMNFYLV